jgi:hypothetical protein
MTPENKKLAMYLGGAVVVGAVGFFVYSFFKKPIAIGSTSVVLGNEEDIKNKTAPVANQVSTTTKTTATNPFKEMLAQSLASSQTPVFDWFKSNNNIDNLISKSNSVSLSNPPTKNINQLSGLKIDLFANDSSRWT